MADFFRKWGWTYTHQTQRTNTPPPLVCVGYGWSPTRPHAVGARINMFVLAYIYYMWRDMCLRRKRYLARRYLTGVKLCRICRMLIYTLYVGVVIPHIYYIAGLHGYTITTPTENKRIYRHSFFLFGLSGACCNRYLRCLQVFFSRHFDPC